MHPSRINELKGISKEVRKDVVDQIYYAGCGNIGGCFSSVELLTYLYEEFLQFDPAEPNKLERDRFILSKGQAAPTYYSLLARNGFIEKEELLTFRQVNSRLHTHPEFGKVPGIDFSSGSLGQGLSVGIGMALAIDKKNINSKTVVMMGDGELQEGQVWEAIMAASHLTLSNLILVIDNNKLQDSGFTKEIMSVEPLAEKLQSFGWYVVLCNGHDFASIDVAFSTNPSSNSPLCIIADTVKGKGIDFMENSPDWHMVANISEELYKKMKTSINSE